MERNLILALLLSSVLFALFLFVQARFFPPEPLPSPPAQAPAESKPPPAPPPLAETAPVSPRPRPAPPERKVTFETPLYSAEVASGGGALEAWNLHFRGEKPMVLKGLVAQDPLTVHRAGAPPVPVAFELSVEPVRQETRRGQIRMVGEDGFGLRITQVLTVRIDSYVLEHEIRVENRHRAAQGAELTLTWVAPVEWPKEQEGFRGPRPISVVRLAPGESWAHRVYIKDAKEFSGSGWIGFESGVAPITGVNGLYLTALIPRSPGITVLERALANGPAGEGRATKRAEIGIRAVVPTLQPGQAWEGKWLQYLGPMEYERLQALGVGLEKAVYFGGFPFPESWARSGFPTLPMEWIVVPLLRLMRWFYDYVPNYGVAIIILTVITKILFYPLTLKSMASMKAMQALQPQINALRAKYQKKDPQRLQRETMELYRQHKVNPMGGCLPMVIQIPIFFALYAMLTVSTELENAPFINLGTLPSWVPWLGGQCLWICDLATYDPTYVLPILMGLSMFVQQKMSPSVGDPRQAKIMLLMPVFMTFMFLSLASGLVLYWTVSNLLQILQQYYMDRRGRLAKVAVKEVQQKH